jgi:microcystin-dependent protein
MAYPPPVPPATRTDATVMATNHPSDHNLISSALSEILNHIATLETSLYPIGTITAWGGDIPPGNHLLLNGQAILRSSYPELFSYWGTRFGVGDGTSTFNIPDYRGRYMIGANPGGAYFTLGPGEKFGSADATLVSHGHTMTGSTGAMDRDSTTTVAGAHNHVVPLSGSHGFIVDGVGASPTSQIQIGGPAYGFTPFTSDHTGHSHVGPDHLHNSGSLTAVATGGSPTNANLPPSTSINFVVRAH